MTPRLKSLELHGYKTFASRTLFEFPGKVTAIVGPNGSGKSNVADALRWVLGEQSYSLLRGRKTEDMIFAGSEHRPKSGMASAAVTFNNEDNWLPIDFSEVSIARRAYRDGQNEYMINGQKVRLKETAELLGQSGLAERTYTIIGQGLVDAALSLKPDERRRFFEEAAGIGLYRSRREEAITRLDTTRRNLERVNDILSELAPRVKSLERQALRAIEYERIKADLRVLLRDWYGFHWHRLQEELAHSVQVVNAQEERLQDARSRLKEVDNQVALLRGQVQELRNHLNEWHAQLAGLHTQSERVSRNLAVLDERNRSVQDAEKNSQAELARLEEEEKSRRERLVELNDERFRLQTELEDAQAQVSQARIALDARQAERSAVENRLREMRRNLTALETRQVQQKAHQQELQSRMEDLCRSRDNLQKALDGAEEAMKSASARLQQARTTRTDAEVERNEAEEALQAQQQRAAELESRRKQLQDDVNRRSAEETRLRAQLDVIEQAEQSLSGLNQGAKLILQEARQGRLRGDFHPLSSLVDVPAELEQAIAAALGENLDAVVLSADSDPEAVLGFLEGSQKGRATLYPDAWLAVNGKVQAPADGEVLGVASELVRAPEHLEKIVNLLLGQVVVVRHRRSARGLLAKLPATARVVTLRGEVFYGSGAVSAGQEGRGTSVIARPRQKRELQEALDAVQDQINELETELEKLEVERGKQRSTQQELEKRYKEANQQLNQATQAYQQASLAAEQVRQRQEFQKNQLNGVQEQVKRAESELERLSGELSKTAEQAATQSEEVRKVSRSLNDLPLEELQAQVVHWNTNAAVAGRAVKEAERRLEEFQQTIISNQRQQQGIKARLVELERSKANIENEKVQHRQQESQLGHQIDELQSQIEPSEKDLARRESEYETVQANYLAGQQAVSVAERHATQAHLEHSRNRDNLESMRRRIEEDFGLVAFEYSNEISGPTPLPLEGMVEQLPRVMELSGDIEDNINRQRGLLRRMGAINPEAHKEYLEVKERFEFLSGQVVDLKQADEDLRQVITELDTLMKREFKRTFDAVAIEFKQMFTRLFGGGSARLILTDEDNPTETGIDIEARLPGRREQGLSLLSGGERSLTAVALIFSLLKVSPTPFCVMDEVDAMLDEANVGRFTELLRDLSETTQFIVITHNRNTVQVADVIYGITMGKDSASQMISLRLDEVSEDMVR